MENSNVILRQTRNEHGNFQRHFQRNLKCPWKIPTSFSKKRKMTMEKFSVNFRQIQYDFYRKCKMSIEISTVNTFNQRKNE